MFYYSVTKRVRNSCEYWQDLAGFSPSRQDTVPNSLRYAITYFGNTAISSRINYELVKYTPNTARTGYELIEIGDDLGRFARFSLTIVIKKAYP